MFANAAILEAARIGDITEEQLDYQLGVDFKGVVFTVQKALPLLNDGGSIILNASTTAGRAADGISVYGGIKAAIRSFARTWASELRDRKIRVNSVSPGATDTPGIAMLANMLFPGPDAEEQFENYQRSVVPMGRYGTPDEVANAALFLASDLSSFTTGADIPVDGGINQIWSVVEHRAVVVVAVVLLQLVEAPVLLDRLGELGGAGTAVGSQLSGFHVSDRRNALAQWKNTSSTSISSARMGRLPFTAIASK